MIDDTSFEVEIVDFGSGKPLWLMILSPNGPLETVRKRVEKKLENSSFLFVNINGIELDEEDRTIGHSLIDGNKLYIRKGDSKASHESEMVKGISQPP
jgi:hypothetical protein